MNETLTLHIEKSDGFTNTEGMIFIILPNKYYVEKMVDQFGLVMERELDFGAIVKGTREQWIEAAKHSLEISQRNHHKDYTLFAREALETMIISGIDPNEKIKKESQATLW